MHNNPRVKKKKWEEVNSQPLQLRNLIVIFFLVTTIVIFFCEGDLLPNFVTNKGDQTLPLIKFAQNTIQLF